MKLLKSLLFLIVILPAITLAHIPANLPNGQPMPSLAPMLAHVTPTVVNITVLKASSQPDPTNASKTMGVGSGVIFDAAHGLIVTNAHVIHNQKLIVVTLKDGRHFRANLVAKDDGFDIAIVHIAAKNLQALPFGDSDQLKVGDFVSAIGSPFGLTQTVTSGVISALNRSQPQIEGFQSFIQTDAPINPGNSGGALVNMRGQLVGINTAIYTPVDASIGIGFSIPSNMVYSVLEQLLKYGKVKRGMLGVVVQDITPELADAMDLKTDQGSLVSSISPGSPAETAGIKPEDIITKINAKQVGTSVQLRNTLGLMRPGTKIELTLIRNHQTETIHATIGDPDTITPPHVNPFLAGLRLQNFSELEADGTLVTGVLITGISDTSAGTLAGLAIGDIISEVDNQPIKNIQELTKITASAKKQLLLKIYRGNSNSALFLVLQS